MAFTAVKPQVQVENVRQALIKAEQAIELYIQTNNPGLLATADASLTAASAAIVTLQGV